MVVAAFGVFEPGLVTGLYEQARSLCTREQVLAAREAGAVASLRELLSDVPPERGDGGSGTAPRGDRRRRGRRGRAAAVRRTDLAAVAGRPLGSAVHAANLLREYRGDVHQAANVAAGLTGAQMNLVTEYWVGWEHGAYAGTRGWTPEVLAAADAGLTEQGWIADGALTATGRQRRDAVEAATDAALDRVLAPIGDGLPALTDRLGIAGRRR